MSSDRNGLLARFRNRFSTADTADRPQTEERFIEAEAEADPPHRQIDDLDDATFEDATEGGWTVVDFWASWCGPCTMFHPQFVHAADHHTGAVRFARIEVDAAPRTASMVGVQSIPTVVLFDPGGNEVERLTGVPSPAELQRLIARGGATSDA